MADALTQLRAALEHTHTQYAEIEANLGRPLTEEEARGVEMPATTDAGALEGDLSDQMDGVLNAGPDSGCGTTAGKEETEQPADDGMGDMEVALPDEDEDEQAQQHDGEDANGHDGHLVVGRQERRRLLEGSAASG